MFSNIGSGEVVVVVLVILFLFGGKKLPELARGLGESSKELKKVKTEIHHALSDIKNDDDQEDKASPEEKTKGGETGNA
ncbi:TPA: twin-arginine translocase TatA/TatE family subunit [Candidatus Collierbacteria bacterium]|uniref:Sec-independent protein translocase protein TatA n=1 Tax=Candidatus Collierbacteria bacterium GW2011_GWB2_44_22 TaxID=1618387 RepID=A0A0G1HX84_9BACT|nr:MAG: Sec-independent protein translocase protein TatA [Candidatus Collierbacteria bacterium GW2011_GWA2_44_13]KKT50118.1 MAG: Sec-independent protein translocase protein TatA [Candidatus Collierbacteria bacterium GW2011_GWB1_44_197]KKT51726.1 MAG: Sec-independent protein translocase protein TatA [Candidatus Collierbacteria bacterium GW2011_GWB2_44_22]KKT62522.1 MAG: Sec-independent protein translocase protein TatA [Candidatus Collierbacteria bacterium GW2011_GWD1_44_27]KKT66945.1 MAG: Sec-in